MCPMKKIKRPMDTPHEAGVVSYTDYAFSLHGVAAFPARSGRCTRTGSAFFPQRRF